MIRTLLACLLCLSFAAAFASAADEPYHPVPMIKAVEPDSVKVGDILTATGSHLGQNTVGGLFMIQGEKTIEVKISKQTEEAVTFAVPASVKPGRYQLMVLTKGTNPQFLEEPVYFTVE